MVIFETHLHTVIGSHDGAITLEELRDWLIKSDINGICITDHDFVLPRKSIEWLRKETGRVIVQGVEVTTDVGHVLAYGLEEFIPGIHRIDVLRKEIESVNGALVLAHPFRHELSPYYQYGGKAPGLPEWSEVLKRPIFKYVDALEACNGSGTLEEELFVRKAARDLHLPVTGGSDAHHKNSLGKSVTFINKEIASQEDFIKAILDGDCDGKDLRRHSNM